ncbi:MAG: NAD(P)/FAD-dependent oxidoreductase [bacterium]
MADPLPASALPHVVIIGGGFGGLQAARALRRAPVRITLVDRRNHHLFQPLLYQVATAALTAPDIAAPIRKILRKQRNVRVILGMAERIDVAARRVELDDGHLDYDYLVVAAGATHSYFGHDEWRPFAPGLKTLGEALEIRRRVLLAYEAAEREEDPDRRARCLTFVVIGGGPTGVELAGALAEIAHHTMARNFRSFDPDAARVILVEAGPRILSAFDEGLAQKAQRALAKLRVEVRVGQPVSLIDADGVVVGGERITARTVLWGAGVRGVPLAATLGVPLDRGGRVLVGPDLAIPGHPEVFVVGDLAAVADGDRTVPGVAPAAMQGGRHAARVIQASLAGTPRPPFQYRDKGSMATIGRSAAVAQIGRWRFSGYLAWLAWLLVHIMTLVDFRNRITVLVDWAFQWFTWQRGARVVLENPPPLPPPPAAGPPTRPGS